MNDLIALSKHWAIEPDELKNLRLSLLKEKQSLSLFAEQPLRNTRMVNIRGRTAIISVKGVITPRYDFFTFLFGGTALDVLARDLQTALDNDEVDAILLDIDSPGGVAVGPSEMSEMIYKAREKKPVWSYVGRHCCSAAYWLASATEKIVSHQSALLGSIGVVSMIPVQETHDMRGYKNIEIVSTNAKNKRPDPRTPEGLKKIRRELDSLENEFITSIAKYRNVAEDTIRKDFGQGGVMIGSEAVSIGMADMLGTYESVLDAISINNTNQPTNKNKGESKMSDNKNTLTKENITADFLKKECPDVVKALMNEGLEAGKSGVEKISKEAGFKAGVDAERNRLFAIDEMTLSGHDDLIASAKKDTEMTAEKLAVQIIKAEQSKGNSHIDALKKAENKLPKIEAGANANEGKEKIEVDENAPIEEQAETKWKSDASLRAEFNNDKEAFVAYFTAENNGQVKVLSK